MAICTNLNRNYMDMMSAVLVYNWQNVGLTLLYPFLEI